MNYNKTEEQNNNKKSFVNAKAKFKEISIFERVKRILLAKEAQVENTNHSYVK